MRRLVVLVGLLLMMSVRQLAAALPEDELLNSLERRGPVSDFAEILSADERDTINRRCDELLKQHGAALAIVTLPSLQGADIDDFTNRLFAKWGVGLKSKDNGILLLVAMSDRKSRLEVGYQLEPIIPDLLAKRILDNDLRPRFREQRYADGLIAVVDEVSRLVAKGEPADVQKLKDEAAPPFPALLAVVFLASIFCFVGGMVLGVGWRDRQVAAVMFGAVFGGLPMGVTALITGPWSLLIHIPVFLLAMKLSQNASRGPRGRSGGWEMWPPTTGGWNSGGWTNGGWSSGDWSSSGGGFSSDWGGFGGGSSGGGGASSDW